jgi:AmiR/NasT family two-component response regulator
VLLPNEEDISRSAPRATDNSPQRVKPLVERSRREETFLARRRIGHSGVFPVRAAPDPGDVIVTHPESLETGMESDHLRVLIANERRDRLELVAAAVVALGHEVIARPIEVNDIGAATARERPDVALVGLGANSEHALGMIDRIVHEAACPVIVLLHAPDAAFVKEASKRGVFAHISEDNVEDWQSSIDIVLRRFAEYNDPRGAFGRRALIERAKGILVERHAIDEATAFEMLREQSRASNRRVIDLAGAVVDGSSCC